MVDVRELCDILNSETREHRYVEGTTLGGIIIPLIKLMKYDTYIYGCREDISNLLSYMKYNDIQVKAVFDQDKNKSGCVTKYGGVPIRCAEQICEIYNPENAFILINTNWFTGLEQVTITNLLVSAKIDKFYQINDTERGEINGYFHAAWSHKGRIDYYLDNVERLKKTFHLLEDDESKKIMIEFIRLYMQAGKYNLPQCDGRMKYFFGDNKELLYTHLSDEVWVNCGANIGDNVFLYFANGLMAKKVYAFEGNKRTYLELKSNLNFLPEDLKTKVEPINMFIDGQSNFEEFLDERVTFINADIEGNELDMLKVLEPIITRDRPVLAICVYHKPEDLTEIPEFLNGILDNYHYILRKYEACVWGAIYQQELVMYAIPEERKV